MDPSSPRADAVVVRAGRIVAVGAPEIAEAWPDAARVDLAGHTLAPGFIDAHNHLCVAALQPCWGDASAVDGPDALVAAVREHAAAEPDAPWVRLHGWNEHGHGYTPTRDDLDAAGIDRPVVVTHFSLHQCVVSSAALAELGIGRGTPDPPGGEIGHRRDGEPSGLLVERAWSDAHARSFDAYADPDRWAEHIAARARVLLRDGITAIHDAACPPEAEALYASMARAGTLPISVLAMPHPSAILRNDLGTRLDGPGTGDGDERLRVGPVKMFADGGVAIALDTSIGGHPVKFGILMDDLTTCAITAAERGFRVAVHAIGNRGVEASLDAFTEIERAVGDDDHRFRLEHAGVTGAEQWTRLAALGGVAVVQPGFVEHVGIQSQGRASTTTTGSRSQGSPTPASRSRGRATIRAHPRHRSGARPSARRARRAPGSGSSRSKRCRSTTGSRRTPRVRPTRAGKRTNGVGSRRGCAADFVVLDLDADPAQVVETWIDGERVHP